MPSHEHIQGSWGGAQSVFSRWLRDAGLRSCCPCQGFLCGSGSVDTETQPPRPSSVTKHTKLHLRVKLSGLISASEEKLEITFGKIIFRENNKNKNTDYEIFL